MNLNNYMESYMKETEQFPWSPNCNLTEYMNILKDFQEEIQKKSKHRNNIYIISNIWMINLEISKTKQYIYKHLNYIIF